MRKQAALAAAAVLSVAVAATFAPAAAARSSYVVDDAHLLSATAVSQINQQVSDLNAQTGKEVLVVTTDSLGGTTADAAIERSFAQNQVNGVEIFIAKNDHAIRIAGDRASSRFFPTGSYQTIAQTMRTSFKAGDFDGGVENAVGVIINTYRGHESSLNSRRQPVGQGSYARTQRSNSGGFSMGWIWWLIILAVIFFIIRGIFRAIAGPRMMGPGPGYGGPGYGPGYGGGYGGGGGGFWSGMLGGLGGAFLGNELFGNRGGGFNSGGDGGNYAGTVDSGQQADASGWQSDAGQIDTSNMGGASWGDSGGGDSGGGWGGGDSGGGDSGGGW